jgi:hypothetical protein
LPRKKKPENSGPEPLWKTVEKIVKGPKSSKKAIVLGVFLMPAGIPFIGVGELVNNGFTTLFGLLLFFGGVICFLGGITGEIEV